MKRIRSLVILLLACAICTVVSYHYGYARAIQIQKGTFIVSLGALHELRAGHVDQATQKMEALCFGSADMLYGDSAFRNQMIPMIFAQDLIQYRATYRTNSSQWTPVEVQLEKDLANWK